MLVYVWARRNPFVQMNFFGLLPFRAPYLPWVLVAFSVLLGNTVMVDILGIGIGHLYFFLEDVFPNQPGGKKLLATPYILKLLFDTHAEDPNYDPLPEERPGGFDWGANRRGAPENEDARRERGWNRSLHIDLVFLSCSVNTSSHNLHSCSHDYSFFTKKFSCFPRVF